MVSGPGQQIEQDHYSDIAHSLLHQLFPICRSITGNGVRQSLQIMSKWIPFQIEEVPTGTEVFDWTVPNEWNIRDAYIKDSTGKRIVDFQICNLHVVSYSTPINQRMTWNELKPHIHTLPDQPDAIPYLTSYYNEDWGFCMTHKQFEAMVDDEYEVCIDSTLQPGTLTVAECVLPGQSKKEIFFSSYSCHPSMANNELSGPVMMVLLYQYLSALPNRHYTYRFYIGPETIGALVYLKDRYIDLQKNMELGFVLTCCGDSGPFTFKQTKQSGHRINRMTEHVLQHSDVEYSVLPFFPTGSDDRQYCAPGFNLPVATVMRSMYTAYPEYHTSLDNLDFVTTKSMVQSFQVYVNLVTMIEMDHIYQNLKPFGEPHLSKCGLYHTLGGLKVNRTFIKHIRYILNYSDGTYSLLDIAERLNVPIWELREAIERLLDAELVTALSLTNEEQT